MTLQERRPLPLVDHKQTQTKGNVDEQSKPGPPEPAAAGRPAGPGRSAGRPEARPGWSAAGRAEQARSARRSAALTQSQKARQTPGLSSLRACRELTRLPLPG